jgi:hypothetical protein
VVFVAAASVFCSATNDPAPKPQQTTASDSSLYLKVRLDRPVKLSKLKPGDVVQGTLSSDVYSADRELFPAGSHARLTVDHLEKRRRPPDDHWPWVVKAFTPRHQAYPVFTTATVALPAGEVPLRVSLISVSRLREVHAQAKKTQPGQPASPDQGAVEVSNTSTKKAPTPTMVLEAANPPNPPAINDKNQPPSEPGASGPETIPAATRCRILLLTDVSASKSKPGDVVHARLLEPVLLNSRVVLPAGSLFTGRVVKQTPPRWASRAGSLNLTFTDLTLPGRTQIPVSATLAGAVLDRQSHTRIDSEGQLHGERPGKAWMAINLGVSAGLGKVSDDTLQLIIEAIVSTATDVSTAGSGRIAAGCISGVFMITRHGRDVVLPRFTEMDISLDRALTLGAPAGPASAAGGK